MPRTTAAVTCAKPPSLVATTSSQCFCGMSAKRPSRVTPALETSACGAPSTVAAAFRDVERRGSWGDHGQRRGAGARRDREGTGQIQRIVIARRLISYAPTP
ncbi:MAG: hypothetical protein E6J71_07605 [Deltaproteobacteria bacterium]|nr:MAG: hypothetical protein E6J71_07605 [Deltaproteobacteria bacterium]